MKTLFIMFFFTIAALAVGMMALGMCEDPTAGPKIVVAAPVPLTEEQQRVEGAHSRGATLFQYKGSVEGMALCSGGTRILSLDESVKEIRLTSQEALDLVLCKFDPETGNYYSMQDIPGTLPGDSLVWDENGLSDAKYTPR